LRQSLDLLDDSIPIRAQYFIEIAKRANGVILRVPENPVGNIRVQSKQLDELLSGCVAKKFAGAD
jgi:hypothetical protein